MSYRGHSMCRLLGLCSNLCLAEQHIPSTAGYQSRVECSIVSVQGFRDRPLLLQGQLIRLAFNTTQVECGEEHCDVTGRMPHLNDLLQAALVAKADLAELMAEGRTSLQNLADFCTTVARTA